MPLQATSGAASYDAFGGGVPVVPQYIEDVFSTYLYTGDGSTQTITNGIDLSTKGGLVWIKSRMPFDTSGSVTNHNLITNPAAGRLQSNTTAALGGNGGPGFTSTGFQVDGTVLNSTTSDGTPPNNYVSWTFRKQPKFFDIVTFSGTGSVQNISHNLNSAPGCIIVKRTDTTGNWAVYHRSLNEYRYILLNSTANGETVSSAYWNYTAPTSTQFTVGTSSDVNASSGTYVAYLFAHDAGGFGLAGTDNVITCGQYDCNGAGNATVDLGYEPQFFLRKRRDSTGNWIIVDNMRGFTTGGSNAQLYPNLSNAESSSTYPERITATGVNIVGDVASSSNIYIAIRRGPMKVPTSGTSVFAPLTYTGNGTSGRYISGAGFPPDLLIQTARSASENREFDDRLRGGGSTAMNALFSNSTNAEAADSGSVQLLNQDGFTVRSFGNGSSVTYIGECLRRAPSFFDEVCYTGTGSARTITHNLGVVPELMIMKRRDTTANWPVYTASTATNEYLFLNSGGLPTTATTVWNNTAPTASVFSVGTSALTNASAGTYVAYLFSSCAGVSKVGSYTGTGALQTINCGFTSGARFVLIKLISSGVSGSGDWYVWDSARGISSGNDPYLLLNSTSAETTGTNYVDTDTTGFKVTAAGATDINASGDVYLFLAIA